MIKIVVSVSGGKVLDFVDKSDLSFADVSSAVFKLEQIKNDLLALEFDADIELNKGVSHG